MNTSALKVAGLSLRLGIFLVIAVALVYVTIAVCFWCKASHLERGLVTLSNLCAIAVTWITIVMRPRS